MHLPIGFPASVCSFIFAFPFSFLPIVYFVSSKGLFQNSPPPPGPPGLPCPEFRPLLLQTVSSENCNIFSWLALPATFSLTFGRAIFQFCRLLLFDCSSGRPFTSCEMPSRGHVGKSLRPYWEQKKSSPRLMRCCCHRKHLPFSHFPPDELLLFSRRCALLAVFAPPQNLCILGV